jgi:hypothetical protein
MSTHAFGVACFVIALVFTSIGAYALMRLPGRLFWLFWIVAMFFFLWGRNCVKAKNSDEHNDSPLYEIIRAARWWW